MNFIQFADLSAEENRQLKVLQFEAEVLRQSGHEVPERINEKAWRILLQYESRLARMRYYGTLYKMEANSRAETRRKAAYQVTLQAETARRREKEADRTARGLLNYHMNSNSMHNYVRCQTMRRHYNHRIAQSARFGPHLLFDCGFESVMNDRCQNDAARQLAIAHGINQTARTPFFFTLCNLNRSGPLFQRAIKRSIQSIDDGSVCIGQTEKHYLDLFPADRLVMLTKDSKTLLTSVDEDDVYIIGLLVDKCEPRNYTLAQAKREGIRTAALPLDRHLIWKMGNKNLRVNHVVHALLKQLEYNDWARALHEAIPERYFRQPEEVLQLERSGQLRKYLSRPKRLGTRPDKLIPNKDRRERHDSSDEGSVLQQLTRFNNAT